MDENTLNDYTLAMTLTGPDGKEIARTDVKFSEIAQFRKTNGAPPSVLLDSMLQSVTNMALYGPDGISPAKNNLPPRKPGGGDNNFNR